VIVQVKAVIANPTVDPIELEAAGLGVNTEGTGLLTLCS
jgi:hypothetical protein